MALCHDLPSFGTATDRGTVTNESGYHQPDKPYVGRNGRMRCGCTKTTEKGAYRDVTVEMPDGAVVHFYHQTPVVVRHPDGRITLNNGGYKTSSTKERINRHTPSGYYVRQVDGDWYVSDPDGERRDFESGMTLNPNR